MEPWAALEGTGLAQYLSRSRWGYALVNAAHILGIGLLLGAILPLDLRMIGLAWRRTPLPLVERLFRPVAVVGLALAAITGALLFASNAREYAGTGLFQAKMAVVALGTAHALFHLRGRDRHGRARQRLAGAVSAAVWIAALICGRFLGFL